MAGPRIDGKSPMYWTEFRPDPNYPSEVSYAVWIDMKIARLELVAGSDQPGGTWAHPFYVAPAELPRLMAAFNGGFQFRADDARGGYYSDGKTAVPLVPGAASLVIYKNGQVQIGSWGDGLSVGPDVQSVIQNVVLLVDNGQIPATATYTDNSYWGFTLGGGPVAPRSGVGITASGALVYVAGPELSARSLAESLELAGAVRAMTLDANPEWVTFNFYMHSPASPSQVNGGKLYPEMQRSADRFLPPYSEPRDFFEVLSPS